MYQLQVPAALHPKAPTVSFNDHWQLAITLTAVLGDTDMAAAIAAELWANVPERPGPEVILTVRGQILRMRRTVEEVPDTPPASCDCGRH